MNLLHVNATLQTDRAGWWEMMCVRLFGVPRTEVDYLGRTIVLRKWRGRSYFWGTP